MHTHDKIRSIREQSNWTQEDMAEKLNMSISGYSKIERGETKVNIQKLQQIAEVLNINIFSVFILFLKKSTIVEAQYKGNIDSPSIAPTIAILGDFGFVPLNK